MPETNKRIHINTKNPVPKLKKQIVHHTERFNLTEKSKIIILCIGTDRSTGDSLGPITGTFLQNKSNNNLEVLGTLNKPVHAKNLTKNITKINSEYPKAFIIAVDASLGKKSSVGYINVKEGPLKPGTGVQKNLQKIGDMHITGLVNVSGYMEYLVLQSTRLNRVIKMATIIARGLDESITQLHRQKALYK